MPSQDELNKQKQRADLVAGRFANRDTPLVRNCWYVAARLDEVSRVPLARRLAGDSILLFRTLDGQAVALQNRCAHRSFPLSEGTLDGDTIVCRYHGLRYNAHGACVEIPAQPRPPRGVGVRSYPLVERAPFLWIWLGDSALADPALVPHPAWLGHADWECTVGYVLAPGSYVHLHENLLDLSHLSFLHANTFGTPEYALAPTEITITDDDIQVWRHVECVLPAVYAAPLGWQGQRALRRSGSQFVSPALHINTGIFENLERPTAGDTVPTVKVAQILTPETHCSTHYYYALCRNFAPGDTAVSDAMLKGLSTAFAEDLYALEKLTQMHDNEDPATFFEIDIPTDRAGLEMRRRLKVLAEGQ